MAARSRVPRDPFCGARTVSVCVERHGWCRAITCSLHQNSSPAPRHPVLPR
ncbi:hypothetical protein L917_12865 [Phytophthora nicotianae]|uniref:Uncharacterized protein n=1 Tax=Phytophthora nicotianae TaxID=4792 RepID=W2GGK5_PHYNI|nr:hypothetical protein L915_13134 [Phytophthora nicotianae]ETL88039.1 hypothetical protein L917_12865 [Phytophthora nicotianae]